MASWISNPEGCLAKKTVVPIPKPTKQKKERKRLKRSWIKQKRRSSKEIKKEKQIVEEVFKRDEGKCIICGRETNAPPHHTIPKGQGGRGVLASAIDSLYLRAVVCGSCHYPIHHQEGGWNPYTFYLYAQKTGYKERIILMELLIDEWAGWIPLESDLADQIRMRNQERWNKFFKHDIPITPDIIGAHWEEILIQEVALWI